MSEVPTPSDTNASAEFHVPKQTVEQAISNTATLSELLTILKNAAEKPDLFVASESFDLGAEVLESVIEQVRKVREKVSRRLKESDEITRGLAFALFADAELNELANIVSDNEVVKRKVKVFLEEIREAAYLLSQDREFRMSDIVTTLEVLHSHGVSFLVIRKGVLQFRYPAQRLEDIQMVMNAFMTKRTELGEKFDKRTYSLSLLKAVHNVTKICNLDLKVFLHLRNEMGIREYEELPGHWHLPAIEEYKPFVKRYESFVARLRSKNKNPDKNLGE